RIDRVLELEDLAAHVDDDLLREVAAGHRLGHVGDVTHLAGEVGGHEVHVVGQVLPGSRYATHIGLAPELAPRAHLPRPAPFRAHAALLGCHRSRPSDHRIDRVLELEDLAFHIDGDLLRQVALGDGRGHLGDVAHLAGEVAGHQVDVVGEVLPGPGDAAHVGL